MDKFFYTCTVCREILNSSQELLKHVRTHTRLKAFKSDQSQKVSHPVDFASLAARKLIKFLFFPEFEEWTKVLHLSQAIQRFQKFIKSRESPTSATLQVSILQLNVQFAKVVQNSSELSLEAATTKYSRTWSKNDASQQ